MDVHLTQQPTTSTRQLLIHEPQCITCRMDSNKLNAHFMEDNKIYSFYQHNTHDI